MENEYYPWGGEFTTCSPNGCIAIVLLNIKYSPSNKVAIYGHLKTENIGIEKIIANVISNPHIRYIIVCGDDIRGHRSGSSLIALHKNGIDENNRIIGAPGAIPYIENLNNEAIKRFREQIKTVNLIGVSDKNEIDKIVNKCLSQKSKPFGKPYIAIRIIPEAVALLGDKRALHSKIVIDYMGKIKRRGE
jgi:tetrahydromethanopterin S-methyltransferase subunit A